LKERLFNLAMELIANYNVRLRLEESILHLAVDAPDGVRLKLCGDIIAASSQRDDEKRADVNQIVRHKATPALYAASGGHWDVVEVLIPPAYDAALTDEEGCNIVHRIARSLSVRLLIVASRCRNFQQAINAKSNGRTASRPLDVAVQHLDSGTRSTPQRVVDAVANFVISAITCGADFCADGASSFFVLATEAAGHRALVQIFESQEQCREEIERAAAASDDVRAALRRFDDMQEALASPPPLTPRRVASSCRRGARGGCDPFKFSCRGAAERKGAHFNPPPLKSVAVAALAEDAVRGVALRREGGDGGGGTRRWRRCTNSLFRRAGSRWR